MVGVENLKLTHFAQYYVDPSARTQFGFIIGTEKFFLKTKAEQ